jgi:hypothetical protein
MTDGWPRDVRALIDLATCFRAGLGLGMEMAAWQATGRAFARLFGV